MAEKEYDNTNSGVLFKREKKSKNSPDYGGEINVNGTEYWLSCWVKKSRQDKTFLSLSVQPKEDQPSASGGEDVPF